MYDELVKQLRRCAVYLPEKFSKNAETLDVLMKAADAIENTSKAYQMMAEAYEAEVTKSNWIPVTEQLPSKGTNVLVYEFGRVEQAYITTCTADSSPCWVVINGYSYHRISDADCPIKWWMPLPQAPKEE